MNWYSRSFRPRSVVCLFKLGLAMTRSKCRQNVDDLTRKGVCCLWKIVVLNGLPWRYGCSLLQVFKGSYSDMHGACEHSEHCTLALPLCYNMTDRQPRTINGRFIGHRIWRKTRTAGLLTDRMFHSLSRWQRWRWTGWCGTKRDWLVAFYSVTRLFAFSIRTLNQNIRPILQL